MSNHQTFIIAEAGVNHNGSRDTALRLIDVAVEAKADAVKFQSFVADKLTRRGAEKAEYQKRATGDGDQHAMLRSLELPRELHQVLFDHCAQRGIAFMSTAFDAESLDMLVELGISRIKIPSGEITNLPLLIHAAQKDLPIILSTGMAAMEEIHAAVATIADARRERGYSRPLTEMLTILHCTSNYPAEPADVNLRAMSTIATETDLPVGYSDHTLGTAVSVAAVALGAVVIEKHFTLDKTMPGPDHAASLTPGELTRLVAEVRAIDAALGDGIKQPRPAELPVRDVVRRSITAKRAIPAGATITGDDLELLRPGTGLPPAELPTSIGRKAARDIKAGETLVRSDLI